MALTDHNTFLLGKAGKTKREIAGKTTKLVRREIFSGGQMVGAIELTTGGSGNEGWVRGADDSLILRWERPKRTAVEYFFYSPDNQQIGSMKQTSSLLSTTKEVELRDAGNTLFAQFTGKANKMTKEKNAGVFKDRQGNVVGRTWRGFKDASGMKGSVVEAHAHQDMIIASVLPLAGLLNWHPDKY